VFWARIGFNADPDPDPDPAIYPNASPDPTRASPLHQIFCISFPFFRFQYLYLITYFM
jgi:hypothetical protein